MSHVVIEYETNRLLNLYFKENAQLRQADINRIRGKVTDIIKRLAVLCHRADPRFSDEADFVGSFWQGLKVGEPDEFDVNFPFDLGPLLAINQAPTHTCFDVIHSESRYRGIRHSFDTYIVMDLPTSEFRDAPVNKVYAISHSPYAVRGVSHDGVVVPALVRQHFRKILMQALNDLHYPGVSDVKQNGPAINVTFYIDGLEVDVDFTPTIAVPMPRWLRKRWPGSKWWPGKNWANDVIARGLNLVAKDSEYFFNISFGLCEKELSKFADSQGGVRKKCHRLMKQFAEDFWFPGDDKPFVDSYKLKNIWLWQCEERPQNNQWDESHLFDRIEDMIKDLCDSLREGRIPLYFNPDVNLLEGVDRADMNATAYKIKHFLNNINYYLERKLGLPSPHDLLFGVY